MPKLQVWQGDGQGTKKFWHDRPERYNFEANNSAHSKLKVHCDKQYSTVLVLSIDYMSTSNIAFQLWISGKILQNYASAIGRWDFQASFSREITADQQLTKTSPKCKWKVEKNLWHQLTYSSNDPSSVLACALSQLNLMVEMLICINLISFVQIYTEEMLKWPLRSHRILSSVQFAFWYGKKRQCLQCMNVMYKVRIS